MPDLVARLVSDLLGLAGLGGIVLAIVFGAGFLTGRAVKSRKS